MYKKIIFIAIVLFTIVSCEKAFDPGKTKAVKVENEWWVEYYVDGVGQTGGFTKLMTYNTAANNDSIWVDDLKKFWQVKFRAKYNADSLTFHVTNSANNYYESGVTVTGGKVMPKAAHSPTGVVTDSIYFKIQYSDDTTPFGTTYEVKGYARTGWAGDDH
jgi:hypothetical protein